MRFPLKTLKARKATLVLKARRESEALQVLTAHKVLLVQKVILVIPDRPARAHTLPHRLAVTRAHRQISTQTLPQCRGLRRRLRRFKEVES